MDRVCIGLARAGMTRVYEFNYGNQGRETVQAYTMEDALLRLIETLESARRNGRRRQTVLIIVSLSVAAQMRLDGAWFSMESHVQCRTALRVGETNGKEQSDLLEHDPEKWIPTNRRGCAVFCAIGEVLAKSTIPYFLA